MSNEEIVEDGMMSVRAACAFTGLSRSELYATMSRGDLPYVQHGRRRLIPKRGLAEMLARGVRGGRAAARLGA